MVEVVQLGRVEYDELEQDVIALLYRAAKRAYRISLMGNISAEEEEHASEQAERLKDHINTLIDIEFEENTEEFKRLSEKLQVEIVVIKEKVQELTDLADTIETVAQVLAIVDDLVAIAAGLAGSA